MNSRIMSNRISIGQKYKEELGLTKIQADKINTLYKEYMKEYIIPTSYPYNEKKELIGLLREILSLLNNEQRNTCKEKRTKPKSLISHIKKRKSSLIKQLENKYAPLELLPNQVEKIYKIIHNRTQSRSPIRFARQEKIRQYLKATLEPSKLLLLEKIFLEENIKNTKSNYNYLDLDDVQAKKTWANKVEMSKHKYRQWENHDVQKAFFKSILSDKQYQKFIEITERFITSDFKKVIQRDLNRANGIKQLNETTKYYKSEILPLRAELARKIRLKSNSSDLKLIKEIRNDYSERIDYLIEDYRNYHMKYYGNEMPLTLKLNILSNSFSFLSPRAEILDTTLNLDSCEFSFKKDDKIWAVINKLNTKIRNYQLSKIEDGLDKLWNPAAVIGRRRAKAKYEDLYNAILIDEEVEENIKKMKSRRLEP